MNPRITIRTLMFTFLVLSAVACKPDLSGIFDFSSIATIRVFVQNRAMEAFTVVDGPTVEVGQIEYLGIVNGYFQSVSKPEPPFNRSFDITRSERFIARVTFRVLRYPADGELQDTTIVISEESTDVFVASTVDTDWIAIVAVQQV